MHHVVGVALVAYLQGSELLLSYVRGFFEH